MGKEWRDLYNVIQRRVTAKDSDQPADLVDANSGLAAQSDPKCSCCNAEFSIRPFPLVWSQETIDFVKIHTMNSADSDLHDVKKARALDRQWKQARQKVSKCVSCSTLHWRKQARMRAVHRKAHAPKASTSGHTPLFTIEELEARKKKKAAEVRSRGITFSKLVEKICPARHTYYLHALVWHFPGWIERLNVDIMDMSGSGIEQINLETNRLVK
jgi:hypothetical protein